MSIFARLKAFFTREKCKLCDRSLGRNWEHLWYSAVDDEGDGGDKIFKVKICGRCGGWLALHKRI